MRKFHSRLKKLIEAMLLLLRAVNAIDFIRDLLDYFNQL